VTVSCSQVAGSVPGETAISGTILAGEAPARLAYLRVNRPDGEFVTELRVTGSGAFEMPIRPGRWRVVCFAPHAGRLEQELDVHEGDRFELVFHLEPAA
jgi:hypothetical protein